MNHPYAPATVWDIYHTAQVTGDVELNPQGWWVPSLLPFLVTTQVQRVLDVGCGTGGDAVTLAQKGYHVTGMDYSNIALPFPFEDAAFDAVMSNVALHMFDDQTTRRIVGEMRRVVRSSGLLLLHVNSTEDMPYRSQRLGRLRVQELEPNFYREANGQTIHFFSEDYCRDVLADWTILDLTHL